MKPLKLTLQGFEGVHAAFARDTLVLDLQSIPDDAVLVAFVGPNGSCKSTVLDNLHPYRCMPSRSTTLGPGGFSYWDQLHGMSAMKELLWQNGVDLYRTVLTFKISGKSQKSDCYLYWWNKETEDWTPAKLDDGTLSDGKSSTYDRCIDTILGPPEKFFTAHFASQGRKTIDQYGNGDVKSILASVLNLQNFRGLAGNAALVAKYLRQQLTSLNDEIAELRAYENTSSLLTAELERIGESLSECSATESTAKAQAQSAHAALSRLTAKRDSQAKDIEERRYLADQMKSLISRIEASKEEAEHRYGNDLRRCNSEIAAADIEIRGEGQALHLAKTEIARLENVLSEQDLVKKSVDQLSQLQRNLSGIDEAIESHQISIAGARPIRVEMSTLVADQARLAADGKGQQIRIATLKTTASLIDQVPCQGLSMQLKCPLLEQANAASKQIPLHENAQEKMRQSYAKTRARIKALELELERFDAAELALTTLQARRKNEFESIDACNAVAARMPLIVEAAHRMPGLKAAVNQHQERLAMAKERLAAVTTTLTTLVSEKAHALSALDSAFEAEAKLVSQRLATLELLVSENDLVDGVAAAARADNQVLQARAQVKAFEEQKVTLLGKLEGVRTLAHRAIQLKEQAGRLQEEIAKWKLLEKGLGNDGCVALSIDDAGPEIAAICNRLLADCFDGRFSVRLDTQSQTKAGDLKETFDVKVFDGHRGAAKSLSDMSGGEKVLVNECVTRSVALYQAQSDLTHCETLFTDETDGALDPEAKRHFMHMKRAVVKQGGYSREYFITHTPELWQMADHQIVMANL